MVKFFDDKRYLKVVIICLAVISIVFTIKLVSNSVQAGDYANRKGEITLNDYKDKVNYYKAETKKYEKKKENVSNEVSATKTGMKSTLESFIKPLVNNDFYYTSNMYSEMTKYVVSGSQTKVMNAIKSHYTDTETIGVDHSQDYNDPFYDVDSLSLLQFQSHKKSRRCMLEYKFEKVGNEYLIKDIEINDISVSAY